MDFKKRTFFSLLGGVAVLCGMYLIGHHFIFASPVNAGEPAVKTAPAPVKMPAAPSMVKVEKPKYVRGIHLTSWIAGSNQKRAAIEQLMDETELNTVVIDIKEYEGEVYIPGVKKAEEAKAYVPAIPDIEKYLVHLKSKGIYPIARIVVFKDNIYPRRRPQLGVKTPDGSLWKDRKGIAWFDPYNKDAWDYNLDIAERALDLGFEEIQFDYIRFPSDGNISSCRYSQVHSSTTSSAALVGFLKEAHQRLKPRGAAISIDVFGLTTTVRHDMGIGQKIMEMSEWVDYVSPMVYPSHYAKGEYRIADPNKAPYKTVYLGLEGAKKRLGEHASKLRPYLQDFSLGYHYGAKEVRDQIQAAYDNDMGEWLLWNPRCVYTRAALKERAAENTYEKKQPPDGMFPAPQPKTGNDTPKRVMKNPASNTAAGKQAMLPAATSQAKATDETKKAPVTPGAKLIPALEQKTTSN